VVEAHPVAATFPAQVRRQMMEARRDVKSKNLNVVTMHVEELAGSHKLRNEPIACAQWTDTRHFHCDSRTDGERFDTLSSERGRRFQCSRCCHALRDIYSAQCHGENEK
jgi:hypothetical protein